jgi:hypothetical protein
MTPNQQKIADSIVASWPYESKQGDGIHELLDYVKTNYGSEVLACDKIMKDVEKRLGMQAGLGYGMKPLPQPIKDIFASWTKGSRS